MTVLNEQLNSIQRQSYYRDTVTNEVILRTNPLVQIDTTAISHDPFGRMRVSQAIDLFNNKAIYDVDGVAMKNKAVGNGTITHMGNEPAFKHQVTSASGDRTVRQSRYATYLPGKAQLIIATGVIGIGPKTNSVRRIGHFDDYDGSFFELDGNTFSVVVRSYVTGVIIEDRIPQSQFNYDKLDGTGPSGIVIDLTKTQIFVIDFQWLGVGIVRFGFDIGGTIIPIHNINHANLLAVPYSGTPTLPIRYELYNKGVTSGTSYIKEICCTILSEGGFSISGRGYHACHGFAYRNVGTVTTPVVAIRLTTLFMGKKNRISARLQEWGCFSEGQRTLFHIYKYHSDVTVTGGSWAAVNTMSGIEVNYTLTAISSSQICEIDSDIVEASTSGSKTTGQSSRNSLDTLDEQMYLNLNVDGTNSDVFVVFATAATSTTNVSVNLHWLETF